MTYEELHKKTVAELREIAQGLDHEAVHGFTQMNKDHLLPAVARALGIHEHHDVTGIDKLSIKAKMHQLRQQREAALTAHDSVKLKSVRRQLHRLNRQIRAHTA